MAKKEQTQQSEQQIQEKVLEAKKKLYELRFQKAAGKLEKTHEIRIIRKEIARMLTFLGQKAKEVRA
jgi:large subunit ribosomal protein L29